MQFHYNLKPGDKLVDKYEVIDFLGSGWEGEVYKIKEIKTGIERAAKLFFHNRNTNDKAIARYAKKLHKLRNCDVLIHYHTLESIEHNGHQVSVFISEYVEGQLLTEYLKSFKGKRLPHFHAVHLLHQLTIGLETIHALGEYHGDLHAENIIVQNVGLTYDLKFVDLYHHGRSNLEKRQHDLLDIVRIFYDALGGQKNYAKHPQWVKYICCGLKQSLILQKFRTVSALRVFLETESWQDY